MNKYRKVIEEFRSDQDLSSLAEFACKHNGKTGYGQSGDEHYWERKRLIFELYNRFSGKDKTLIKWLLHEELKGFEFDIPVYTLDVCAFMLYKEIENEDVYDLYEAKFGGGSDAQAMVDIELIFGKDLAETKTFLKGQTTRKEESQQILETIDYYESNPNAKFKTREEYIHFFENRKIKHHIADLESMES